MKTWQNIVIACILGLAATHCSLSIFYDNSSYVDLKQYESGHARLPFQARFGMVPVLRFFSTGRSGPFFARFAHQDGQRCAITEENTPERAISQVSAEICMLLLVMALSVYGWTHFRSLWWMPATITIAGLLASFAARYTQNLWYPYDLPHILLFGMMFLCILTQRWGWLCVSFALDCTMHESSIFILPSLLVPYLQGQRKTSIGLAAALSTFWVALSVFAHHLYAGNPAETGIHYHQAAHSIYEPHLWPQVASACGFLLIPAIFARKFLAPDKQILLWSLLPGVLAAALFGIWYESRVWAPWCAPLAILITYELEGWFKANTRGTSPNEVVV